MTSTMPALGEEDRDAFPGDRDSLLRALEKIAAEEARFTECFYETFFGRRPDTLPLFGVHSIPEREEMMRETLHSLHALVQGESWLAGNLEALGKSHEEYGVTADMYDSYCDSLIDCARQTLAEPLSDIEAAALRLAIVEIARQMSEAAAIAKSDHQLAADARATRSD
jgi:hemoglobin-like flavoprotein